MTHGKGFNFRDLNDKVLLHQDIGFGPKYINYSRQIEYDTLAKEAIKVEAKREAISEEMRVLYVALTRAKEKLIIVGSQKEAKKELNEKKDLIESVSQSKLQPQVVKNFKTYLDWLELVHFKMKKENKNVLELQIHSQKEIENASVDNIEENNTNATYVAPELKKELKKIIEWQYKNISLTTIPSKTSVTSIKPHNQKQEEKYENIECMLEMPEFMQTKKSLTGAQRGTIMHLVLQKLDLKKLYTKPEIEEFVSKLVAKKLLTEEEAKAVNISKLEKFLNSSLASDIRRAQKIYQEKPFYLYIPAKEIYGGELEEKIVVQGIIDLYYRNSEGKLILVDYKTDYVEDGLEGVLIEKYKMQIDTYKKAIEQGTGEKVEKAYIYSLHLEKQIEI